LAQSRSGHEGPVFVPVASLGKAVEPSPDGPPPCHLCTARCCKYIALEIDRPTTPKDCDQIRWFLLHEGVKVWAQDGGWFLELETRCRHLEPTGACGIYETRPQLCRDYGLPEIDGPCEYFSDDAEFDLHFTSAEAFDAWAEVQMERREKRLARRRKQRKAIA
jgi:Fe-S-cluster containining protein